MRFIGRLLRVLLIVIVLAIAGLAAFVAARQHLRFDRPEPAVTASTDPAVIARGHYVVRSLAQCASCHGAVAQRAALATGEDIPLSGGYVFRIPPGEFYPRNITPDPGTGIGSITDGKLARALRYGVGHDGRALVPFMEMQGLSDEDLTAVISYLKSQPPVRNVVPENHFNLLGKVVRATVMANPVGPAATPPRQSPHGATVENGRYLAGSVANCWACHTERNLNTGELLGPRFSGNRNFADDNDPKRVWAPPNLTSDPKTGRLARFTEDEFVARFRVGRVIPESPMPWTGFSKMSDEDLRAIYRYLKTLPPVVNDVGPPVREKS